MGRGEIEVALMIERGTFRSHSQSKKAKSQKPPHPPLRGTFSRAREKGSKHNKHDKHDKHSRHSHHHPSLCRAKNLRSKHQRIRVHPHYMH